jgi:class 3 adenylate cyclase
MSDNVSKTPKSKPTPAVRIGEPELSSDTLKSIEQWLKASEGITIASKPMLDIYPWLNPPVLSSGGPAAAASIGVSFPLYVDPKTQQLEQEIGKLRVDIQKQAEAVKREKEDRQEREKQLEKMAADMDELRSKQELAFLLSRVTPAAHSALFGDKSLRNTFFEAQEQEAYVVAIDIRRSTDLMLKARRPQLFATFMTQLCSELAAIVKDHFGVFDKFTGDGILAFFPEFFTGDDAGYHALAAAHSARQTFDRLYKEHRSSFTTVLTGVQLAIGIDYGPVHLVRVADGLTVVGRPVVYACRLSGGLGGQILLNQPSYEDITKRYSPYFFTGETSIEIKHEGSILCYEINPNNTQYTPKGPPWIKAASDASHTNPAGK